MKKINASPEQLAKAMFDAADRKAGIRKAPRAGEPLKVIAGTPDKPLVIASKEIPCYVLEDETRVLSQQGFLEAVGRSPKAKGGHGASTVDKPPAFLAPKNLKPFIGQELYESTTPIPFKTSEGRKGYGYRAETLPQVCTVYLQARKAGALLPSQMHIADRAEILLTGLATVGIVALVDEATGYQQIRERRALATILEKYIAKNLQPWTKTFPYEFYAHIYRLKGWDGPHGTKRPAVIGHYTNDFVYSRIAPGVLRELQKRNPVQDSGNRRSKHHQWFTPEPGHSKLKEHLAGVLALMRVAPSWDWFKRNITKAYPKLNEQFPLEFNE